VKRGEVWWADLGAYRMREQTGRRPVVIWRSDTLTRLLQSVLVIPLTTNLDRANLAGTAIISAGPMGLSEDSVALAFQMRAIPKSALESKIRPLTDDELAELELATDEAIGRARRISALIVNQWLKYEDSLRAEGREQGLEQGLRQGIALALELKFGSDGQVLLPAIDGLHDARQLQAALDAVRRAAQPMELAKELAALVAT